MLKELKELLKQAKKEKAAAIQPYNQRIRTLQSVITNLEKFDGYSAVINGPMKENNVATLPQPEQAEE
ncbi:hypothetical protein GW756_06240 [bacterium]|nr:hypothetical protein [bacterium]